MANENRTQEDILEEAIVSRLENEINVTHPQALEIQLKLYDIFIPILCSIIIFVNLLIVLSSGLILHKRQQPRSTYIFLGNVALSDLVVGIATIFGQYYPHELRNEIVCCISIGLTVSATLVSVLSVGLIGVDRYLYILYGLQYQRYLSSKRARIMVLSTWLLAGLIGFLPAMGFRNPTDNGKLCWFIVLVPPKLVLMTTTVGLMPLVVIVCLYSIILKHALGRISHLQRAAIGNQGTQVGDLRLFRGRTPAHKTSVTSADVSDGNVSYIPEPGEVSLSARRSIFSCCRKTNKVEIAPVYSANKWKAIKIVLLTTGAFFITWFPYFFASTLYVMCSPDADPDYCDGLRVAIASPLAILGLSNSLMNPIIYAWWHNGFRESVKKMYNGILPERFRKDSTKQSSTKRGLASKNIPGTATTSTELDSSDLEQRFYKPPRVESPPIKRHNSTGMESSSGNEL